MTRRLARLTPIAAALMLAGCVNLAPAYHRPAPVTPNVWPWLRPTPGAPPGGPAAADIGWREFFIDPRLRNVVALALANNRNLQVAALDIEQAREQYRATGAALFPSISATASATVSRSGNTSGSNSTTSGQIVNGSSLRKSESAELGFTSYELDFFGKLRNQRQQALEALRASAATRRVTQISLIAETASDWLTLAADRQTLALAHRTEGNQQANLRLVTARHRYGIATGSDLADAETSVASAGEDVATYRSQVAQDIDALNLVVGTVVPAPDLPGPRVPARAVLSRLPAGVPSQVLENRPDVAAAEYTLRGDDANIGAARAAFFPTISLTAAAGYAAPGLTALFSAGRPTWSVSPQASLPIFDAGSRLANLRISQIQRRIDVANYQQTVQTAFREVADALAIRAHVGEQIAAQRQLVAASRRAYTLALDQYHAGTDSYLDTLVSQRSLYSARQTLIQRRLTQQTNLVTLYKALGSGVLATGAGGARAAQIGPGQYEP